MPSSCSSYGRIGTFVDEHLIPEQAGFRPGKSTTSQVLNLTQYIEDGYEEGMVTGVVFVDLSAAYDSQPQTSLQQDPGDHKRHPSDRVD
ncbi:hypothetical protein NHX12_024690 [Muraenolepis orangiensis]|uniref:Reverse transcriptase domain-containing protein n=1 Tax=Muraenolepis orangiensis TaxID=630683 RepID=A0A9Q0EI00_9TELE|nr:hypothetical protein NHX12_024690 [Muraenolepis orangiensis]